MKRCIIFGAGVYDNTSADIQNGDFVIGADAGYEKCRQLGITPDIIIGDFDSSENIPEGRNIIRLPVKKDVTDLFAAVGEGLKHGCDEFHIYGGLGGRPDHSFANYSLIASLAKKNQKAFLYGESFVITAIMNTGVEIKGKKGATVSVFSWTEKCEGVSLKGLEYELENAVLERDFALGVSNSLDTETAEISVKNGILLIMQENIT